VATKPVVSEYGFHARRCCLAPDGWPAGLRSARRCPKGTRSTPGWHVPGREGGVVRARTRSAPHVRLPSACGRVGRCARSARSVDLRSDRPTANQPAERVVAARSGTSRMRSTLRSVWEVRVHLNLRLHHPSGESGRAGLDRGESGSVPVKDTWRARGPRKAPRPSRWCLIERPSTLLSTRSETMGIRCFGDSAVGIRLFRFRPWAPDSSPMWA
jgi:hypothetical protein